MALGKSSPFITSLLSHSQPFVLKLARTDTDTDYYKSVISDNQNVLMTDLGLSSKQISSVLRIALSFALQRVCISAIFHPSPQQYNHPNLEPQPACSLWYG